MNEELTQKDIELMKELLEDGDEYGAYLVSVGDYPKNADICEGMLSTLRW